MRWESSGLVGFDLGSLLQGQMRTVKLKSASNSLIIGPRGFGALSLRWIQFASVLRCARSSFCIKCYFNHIYIQNGANLRNLDQMYGLDGSVVNDKRFLAKITKFAKNIWEPVIENVIILGHLMADASSKRQKIYIFCEICHIFTLQPLRAVGVLFSPMVSGWAVGWAGGGKKFVRAISQKP